MSDAAVRSTTPSRALGLYVLAVVGAGTLVLAHATLEAIGTPHPIGWVTLAILALLSGWLRLTFTSVSATSPPEQM